MSGKQYRIRHGDYRIFFEVIDGEPKIINIMQVKRRTTTNYKH
ncbi:type II toxin-antitoxin system RelE/ParE family toxin [uncultured Kingella sp.]